MKAKVHIIVKIFYNLKDLTKTVIKTNAKPERVGDVLEAFLHGQVGLGADERKANEKDEYEITIGVDLDDDTFYTKSDTGNDSLTCGLVIDVYRRLDKIKIEDI
jgi:hypothetical protein